MAEENEVTVGSDNVFADVGAADPEEALWKAELLQAIQRRLFEGHVLNVKWVSDVLGVGWFEASMLVSGRSSKFTVERLNQLLETAEKLR